MERVCMRALHGVCKNTIGTKEIKPHIEENIRFRGKKGSHFRYIRSCRVRAMRHDQNAFEGSQRQSNSALKAIATPIPITTKKVHAKFCLLFVSGRIY
jgi:hypothetical protein